jgi:hypothetical protein
VEYPRVKLPPIHEEALLTIFAKLEEALSQYPGGGFVKLSCRSPKDAALLSERFGPLLATEYAAAGADRALLSLDAADKSLDATVFIRSTMGALHCADATEAIYLLLNSQRIYDDLQLYLSKFPDEASASNWHLEVIVRKWEPIDAALEMRMFVKNGQPTGIMQYHPELFIPHFGNPAIRNRLEQRARELWTQLAPQIPYHDYAIDFAPSRDLHDPVLWVVEINPPAPVSGTGLYNWGDPHDRDLLQHGPCEFRFLPRSDFPQDGIPPWVIKALDQMRGAAQTTPSISAFFHRLVSSILPSSSST